MNLFKRILLSFFPESIINQPVNPASMFVSFISAKQFFSVINRKIVENYKLNLFDISLDSFDVKIGFGEQPTIKVKDIDFYYGYGVSSNLNGYRFLAPGNLGNCIALVSCLYTKENLVKFNNSFYVSFIVTTYLLTFVFISRLKVFPTGDIKSSYSWFIDVFFEFYKISLEQGGVKYTQEEFDDVKTNLLKNIQVFFMLFYFYRNLNSIFSNQSFSPKEYYSMLFYDELKRGGYKTILGDFVDHCQEYTQNTTFSVTEKKIMSLIFPADILIRYIFEDDTNLVVDTLVNGLYDRSILDKYLSSFLKSDEELESFVMYISDYNHFKKNYFAGLKNLVLHKFKTSIDYDTQESLDELLSSVGPGDNVDNIKIPERIKKESMLMEKFINFYVTFIGSFWISRGDNFFIRLFRKDILSNLIQSYDIMELKQDALFFYGGLLYSYSKNVFYYKYAFDNVRAGKEKFNLPFRSTFREVYSNMYIIKLFNENFLASLLQDINQKDIKIYLHNKEILTLFKKQFGKNISALVKMDNKSLTEYIYGSINPLLKDIKEFDHVLFDSLKNKDFENLKESIYTLDFWLWMYSLQCLNELDIDLNIRYSDFSIIGIIASMRDSLTGFLIYYKYLLNSQITSGKEYRLDILKRIYFIDVLGISEEYSDLFNGIIDEMISEFGDMLDVWINIDDNKEYFELGADNWLLFVDAKSDEKIFTEVAGEDIIWFRGFLKNITFYNKRYLIPKS